MNTPTLHNLIIEKTVTALQNDVRSMVAETVTRTIREEVRNVAEREAVVEAVATRVASMDIDVYSALDAILRDSIAEQIASVREALMQQILKERVAVSASDIAYYITSNNGSALYSNIMDRCIEHLVTSDLTNFAARVEETAIERIVSQSTSPSARRRIEDAAASRVADDLLRRMEEDAKASMVPEESADPIRDDAEALLNAVMNGGPF